MTNIKDGIATPIVDKNGKQTTVYKRPEKATAGKARVGKVKPKSAARKPRVSDPNKPSLKERMESYQEELKQSVANLSKDENWAKYLESMSLSHGRYSLNNQILINIQTGGKATLVAGYKTWQEKYNRNVIPGQKAIAIFGFAKRTVDKLDKDGNVMLDEAGKPRKEDKISFPAVGVFDVSQTEGDAIPEAHEKLTADPPAGLISDLEKAIADTGFELEYVDSFPDSRTGSTSTNPDDKRVKILSTLNDGERASVLAHELSHIVAGHIERIDEYRQAHSGHRNVMEVEAESSSYVVLRANGMDAHAASATAYVAGWAGVRAENDGSAIVEKAAENVGKTVKAILEKNVWSNLA